MIPTRDDCRPATLSADRGLADATTGYSGIAQDRRESRATAHMREEDLLLRNRTDPPPLSEWDPLVIPRSPGGALGVQAARSEPRYRPSLAA